MRVDEIFDQLSNHPADDFQRRTIISEANLPNAISYHHTDSDACYTLNVLMSREEVEFRGMEPFSAEYIVLKRLRPESVTPENLNRFMKQFFAWARSGERFRKISYVIPPHLAGAEGQHVTLDDGSVYKIHICRRLSVDNRARVRLDNVPATRFDNPNRPSFYLTEEEAKTLEPISNR